MDIRGRFQDVRQEEYLVWLAKQVNKVKSRLNISDESAAGATSIVMLDEAKELYKQENRAWGAIPAGDKDTWRSIDIKLQNVGDVKKALLNMFMRFYILIPPTAMSQKLSPLMACHFPLKSESEWSYGAPTPPVWAKGKLSNSLQISNHHWVPGSGNYNMYQQDNWQFWTDVYQNNRIQFYWEMLNDFSGSWTVTGVYLYLHLVGYQTD